MRVAAPSPSIALHRLWQAAAHSRPIERRNQTPQLPGIEARLDLDAKTLSEHNPKLPVTSRTCWRMRVSMLRMIVNNLDRDNLFAASRLCDAFAPGIQRMHVQPTRHAKLLAPQTTLLELQYQTRSFRPAPPMSRCNLSICLHPSTSTWHSGKRNNVVARMHPEGSRDRRNRITHRLASNRRLRRINEVRRDAEKGRAILVLGELRTRDYDKGVGSGKKKQDVNIKVTEVFASQLRRMDRRKDSDESIEATTEAGGDEEAPF